MLGSLKKMSSFNKPCMVSFVNTARSPLLRTCRALLVVLALLKRTYLELNVSARANLIMRQANTFWPALHLPRMSISTPFFDCTTLKINGVVEVKRNYKDIFALNNLR